MRVPITNQTRTHADVQLTVPEWRAVAAALPIVPRAPSLTITLRGQIERELVGRGVDLPVRIRVTAEQLAEIQAVARTIGAR